MWNKMKALNLEVHFVSLLWYRLRKPLSLQRKNLVDLCWATYEQREGESVRHTGRHPAGLCLHQQQNRSESGVFNPSHFIRGTNRGVMTRRNALSFIINAFCETYSRDQVKNCHAHTCNTITSNLPPVLMMLKKNEMSLQCNLLVLKQD